MGYFFDRIFAVMVWDMIGVIDAVFNGYFFLTSTIIKHSVGIQCKYRAEEDEYANHICII